MGHDPDREDPFFFQKNANNLSTSDTFPYPPHTSDVHHEAEMLVALKTGGTNIPVSSALDHVYGYGLALDMTRRDLSGNRQEGGPSLGNRQGVRTVRPLRTDSPG